MPVPAGVQPANNPNAMPVVPQPVAEPAAPVAPAAPAPAVEPTVPAAVEPAPVVMQSEPTPAVAPAVVEPTPAAPVVETTYMPTGNQALDSAAKLVTDAGFDPVQLAQEIANGGLADSTRVQMVAKLGEDQVNLLLSTYSREVKTISDTQTAKNDLVYKTVGSKEEWDAIAAWTATPDAGLTDEAATAYNEMLAAGGVQAQLAAQALKEAYMASPGFVQANPVIVTPDAAVPASQTIEPISRPQYVEEMKKAVRTGNAVEAQALDARAKHTMENQPDSWRIKRLV